MTILGGGGSSKKAPLGFVHEPKVIDRTSAAEAAARELRALILSRQLPAGTLLHQGELASYLGVSRTPLREALQRLTAEGLVRIDPHRGAIVAQPTFSEVKEIYELQMLLEGAAARAAALEASTDGVAAVEKVLDAHEHGHSGHDWVESNVTFHTSIYELANRPLLVELIGLLRNRAALYVNLLARSEDGRARADHEHRLMLEALRRHDPDELEKLVCQHLQRTLDWLHTVIEDD